MAYGEEMIRIRDCGGFLRPRLARHHRHLARGLKNQRFSYEDHRGATRGRVVQEDDGTETCQVKQLLPDNVRAVACSASFRQRAQSPCISGPLGP